MTTISKIFFPAAELYHNFAVNTGRRTPSIVLFWGLCAIPTSFDKPLAATANAYLCMRVEPCGLPSDETSCESRGQLLDSYKERIVSLVDERNIFIRGKQDTLGLCEPCIITKEEIGRIVGDNSVAESIPYRDWRV